MYLSSLGHRHKYVITYSSLWTVIFEHVIKYDILCEVKYNNICCLSLAVTRKGYIFIKYRAFHNVLRDYRHL